MTTGVYPRKPADERFWEKVDATGDCWEWVAAIGPTTGYGYFHLNRRMVLAHRYSYEFLVGPIPDGLQVDHLCKNRRCVNPDHLEPVTPRLNRLRGEWGKAAQAAQRNKTHCPKGHPYAGENLYVTGGKRQCRACKDAWQKAKRATIRYARDEQPRFVVTITDIGGEL